MSWLTEVQREILAQIDRYTTPQAQLLEALLWRGFLAVESNGGIFLERWSPRTDTKDREDLQAIDGIEVEPLALDPELHSKETREALRRHLSRISAQQNPGLHAASELAPINRKEFRFFAEVRPTWRNTSARRRCLEALLALPGPEGMTAQGKHPEFGASFPATELDLGVALLVRGLQRVGVATLLSGHGNEEQCRVYIECERSEHLARPELNAFDRIAVTNGRITIGEETAEVASAFANFDTAQKVGRALLQQPPHDLLRGTV